MSQPIWNTPAGSLGVYPSLVPMVKQLTATVISGDVVYALLSGTLPENVTLYPDGLISGIPPLLTADSTYTFAVRATGTFSQTIRDRTFSLTVSGAVAPGFTTPGGTLLSTNDSAWVELPIAYSNPISSNPVIIKLIQGVLPIGLEINEAGLIRGYPAPPIVAVTLPAITTAATITDMTDTITCLSTTGFSPGRPVTFTGAVFGNVIANQIYYIKTITNSTSFTISTTQNGPTFGLNTGTGFMTVSLPAVAVGQPTIRTYSFTLALRSPLGNDTRAYAMTVVNQNTPISQGGPGYPSNTRIPTIFNTRPTTFKLTDSDPYYGYYILPPVGSTPSTIPPTASAFIGTAQSDNFFSFKIIGNDFDSSPIQYSYSGLTLGLVGDTATGWITGTPILYSEGINQYSFSVAVSKVSNPAIQSQFFDFSFNVTNNIDGEITWITPSDLGNIFNGTVSTKSVAAVCDVSLEYRIVDGALPPNLTLSSNGEITGYVSDQPTNQYIETQYATTPFTFTVQAFSTVFSIIQSSKTFTLTVSQEYTTPTDTLYIKAAPSIPDRYLIDSLLYNDTIIPTSSLYRPSDVYFGKATSVIYEHAYGIYANDIDAYIAAVTRNHYWRNITLGELKTAVAKNDAGEIIYEVVYSEVIDNLVNPQGVSVPASIYWPRAIDLNLGPWYTSITDIYTSYDFGQPGPTITATATTSLTNIITCDSTVGLLVGRQVVFSGSTFGNIINGNSYYVLSVNSLTEITVSETQYGGTVFALSTSTGTMNGTIYEPTFYASLTSGSVRTLYPNSLFNMRNRVANILGQEYDSRILPLWMTSQQANGSTLGYTQAWVICYTKPGQSTTIKNNIQTLWLDPIGNPYSLNTVNFKIDRFSVDKSITYNYDNRISPAAWTGLPSATPVPDPLDSKDFYVLFPRETILPDKNQ